MNCLAAALDADATLGTPAYEDGATVPPCDNLGEIEVAGYLLCPDCKEALDFFLSIATRSAESTQSGDEET